MDYYTERNGLRSVENFNEEITVEKYRYLYSCLRQFDNNLIWKYRVKSLLMADGNQLDTHKLKEQLYYLIPDLFTDDQHYIPDLIVSIEDLSDKTFSLSENQKYALLDLIEFYAKNCREENNIPNIISVNRLSGLQNKKTRCESLFDIINHAFRNAELLYKLSDSGEIQRIDNYGVITDELITSIDAIQEAGLRDLMKDAISYYKKPDGKARQLSVETIWDAFERLKTIYSKDKKKSSEQLINNMTENFQPATALLENEFRVLTSIGNEYRIRHHETGKIEISDKRYYDYFFNRCLTVITLALNYL